MDGCEMCESFLSLRFLKTRKAVLFKLHPNCNSLHITNFCRWKVIPYNNAVLEL